MDITLEALGLDRLSPDEKLELAGRLWESVVGTRPAGALLTDAQRAILQQRIADAAANPGDYISWDEARAKTLERLS